jgi:hypothetical protein
VRYYGWYSNKMRGQRKKHAEEEKAAEEVGEGVEVMNVSEHQPRRIPSKKRSLLRKRLSDCDGRTMPSFSQKQPRTRVHRGPGRAPDPGERGQAQL